MTITATVCMYVCMCGTIANITGWGTDQTNMWLQKVPACPVEGMIGD